MRKKLILYLIFGLIFIGLSLIPTASGIEIQTTDKLYNTTMRTTTLTFTITSDDGAATSHWILNGVDLGTNVLSQTIYFNEENFSYLNVYQTNGALTSNTITYTIIVTALLDTSSFTKFDTTLADNVTRAVENSSITEVLVVSRDYYTNLLGLTFYVFVWGIYAGMLYIRQNTWHIPAILAIILSAILLSQLPAEYRGVVQLGTIAGAFAVIYSFFKSKR